MAPPKHRILLIDTDSKYLSRLFDVLAMGYEVIVRNDTVSALNKLHHYEPDVIVLETNLPEIDGFEFARMLRRRVEHRSVPVIFLAKKLNESDRRMAGMVGAMLCMSKDEPLGKIAASISHVVQQIPVLPREKQASLRAIYDEQHDEALRETKHPRPPIRYGGSHHPTEAPPPKKAKRPAPTPQLRAPVPEPVENADGDLLPMGPTTPPPETPKRKPVAPPRPRVLIAHRDKAFLDELADDLSEWCDCLVTASGVETVDKAGRYRPDMIILSMRLTGVHGFEVSQMLRSEPHFAEIPIMGIVDTEDTLRHEDMWRYGITRLFALPENRNQLLQDVAAFATGDDFHPHDYPQTYEEALEEEDEKRLKRAKRRAEVQEALANREFRSLFRDAVR